MPLVVTCCHVKLAHVSCFSASGGTTKEDVLASSKKPTSYKAHKYTTEYQRDCESSGQGVGL